MKEQGEPIFVRPVEMVTEKDGHTGIIIEVRTNAPDEEIKRALDVAFNIDAKKMTDDEVRRAKTFGFSSSNWNAPWNPEGPKPNWRPGSSNPSAN